MRLFEKSSKHSEYDKKWKLRKTFFGTSILMNFIDMSRKVHSATAKQENEMNEQSLSLSGNKFSLGHSYYWQVYYFIQKSEIDL